MPNEIDNFIQQALKQIRLLTPKYCDNCGTLHAEADFSFVGNREGALAFQVTCGNCAATDVFQTNPNGPGVSMRRFTTLNTDVRGGEVARFAGKPQVAKDEAIAVHQSLRKIKSADDLRRALQK